MTPDERLRQALVRSGYLTGEERLSPSGLLMITASVVLDRIAEDLAEIKKRDRALKCKCSTRGLII